MTKDDLNITDRKYIESRLRYFKRRGEIQQARNLMYKHLLACNIDPTICVDGEILPLIKEHGDDSLTPPYSLPRVMSAPFQLKLCWNQVVAYDVFFNFIRHSFSTLQSFGLKTGHSEDCILYLEYLRKCLVDFETFDVSVANKARKDWGSYDSLDGRKKFDRNRKYKEESFHCVYIWHAFFVLEEWTGLTAPYNPSYPSIKPKNITKLIYLAIAKEKKPIRPRRRAFVGDSHISDEDSATEMEWQKSLLLKYLFGMPISENDLKDDRPISPRPQEKSKFW